MAEDFQHRHVGSVAIVIAAIVFVVAFVGLILNFY